MSVRVVARLRPLLKGESQEDAIITCTSSASSDAAAKNTIRIPNPKNESENFSFQFSSVYDQDATQSNIFDAEVSPTIKHLFKGFDVTLFAYGVTGTGKTHTMRGGKSLADRGVIPRLLSAIYRRARKVEKDTEGDTTVEVSMSYYEIYNDRVFDLFEAPEKRTAAGLPIRDVGNGRTQVVGLSEQPCTSLKEFESLYDQANVNRSTSATKLNAHSSRSHAILCVKLTQTTGNEVRVATVSAIDLAGSEDNRRTDNNKERLVESSAINKSLFVLAQCVEAISKKQSRIPYRESKMTRILSLGQNNGLTVMILNLSPLRSFHLDTLSSLNFANRTKKVEVNEIENQPFFRDQQTKQKQDGSTSSTAPALHRQPLRPKLLSQNCQLNDIANVPKPAKSFAVYADKPKIASKPAHLANTHVQRSTAPSVKSPKRTSSEAVFPPLRPAKLSKASIASKPVDPGMSKEAIEALIERKVNEALAERADHTIVSTGDPISDEVQRRLEALEKRVVGKDSERSEGLQYLLMAKQHQVRGELASALKMYQLALPHFPQNEKLMRKMANLQSKLESKATSHTFNTAPSLISLNLEAKTKSKREQDDSFHEEASDHDDESEFEYRPRTKVRKPQIRKHSRSHTVTGTPQKGRFMCAASDESDDELASELTAQTPRTKRLLHIINTKDVSQIQSLKGVGAKKAEAIVNCLCDLEDDSPITSLTQLGKLKGIGVKTVETARSGIASPIF